MMFTWPIVALFAASITCITAQTITQNAPTHVPKRCFLDKAQGSCNDYTRNFYFNLTTGHCQPFVYSGCGGNWNRFSSLSECHRTCTCAIPPESGPCRGYFKRWFYSPEDGCCRPFVYGGCGGNKNSYETWTECSENCGYPTANSSWWTWGAQWGNVSASQLAGQTTGSQAAGKIYTRNDFMRDWMLWSLLSGGEGFEMEDIASVIAQAHILGIGKSMGGTGMAGGGFGYGSQMFGQEGANGFGVTFGNNGFQESGMRNLGPTYQTRPGSFTPLGQVGSVANLMNGEFTESMAGAHAAWNQLEAAGLVGGSHGTGIQSHGMSSQGTNGQSNWGFEGRNINAGLEQRWTGSPGSGISGLMQGSMSRIGNSGTSGAMNAGISSSLDAEMSGQGSWGTQGIGQPKPRPGGRLSEWGANRWMHGEGRWNTGVSGANDIFDIGSGALGYRGFGQSGSNPKEVGNAAIEILHLIGQIGRGALRPSDLINLGQRYGAVNQMGHVDVNLLATRLVSELQGPRGETNMARLKGVAQRLGALDSNGNINLPLLVDRMSGTLSNKDVRNTFGGIGIPSVDEFNWLGSRKGSVSLGVDGSSPMSIGGTGRGGPLLREVGKEGSVNEGFGIGQSSPSQGGGVSRRRLGMTGSGDGRGLTGGAVGGISGAIRGLMGGDNRSGRGGANGFGTRGSGIVGGAGTFGGSSGTVAVQSVNVGGGSRRMGSYGRK